MNDQDKTPPFVTFETGAKLLRDLGMDPDATGDSVRYTARTHPEWEFGEGRQREYVIIANARTMETGAFIDFHQKHPRTGRGRDKASRKRKREAP